MDELKARFLEGLPPGIPLYDSHGHMAGFSRDYPIRGGTAEAAAREMDRLGIARGIVTPIGIIGTETSRKNDQLLAECRKFPARLTGFALVNLNWEAEDILRELDRCLAAGLSGIKIIAPYQGCPDDGPRVEAVTAYAHERRLAILNHWWHDPAFLDRMARTYPDTQLIQGHYPGPGWADAVNRHENVWLSTANYYGLGSVEEMVRVYRGDRITWGSDLYDLEYGWTLGPILMADIPEAARRAILSDNGRELFRRIDAR